MIRYEFYVFIFIFQYLLLLCFLIRLSRRRHFLSLSSIIFSSFFLLVVQETGGYVKWILQVRYLPRYLAAQVR